jgi:hypothetical protein
MASERLFRINYEEECFDERFIHHLCDEKIELVNDYVSSETGYDPESASEFLNYLKEPEADK